MTMTPLSPSPSGNGSTSSAYTAVTPKPKCGIVSRISQFFSNAFSELICKKQEKWVRKPGKWYEPGVSEKVTSCAGKLMPNYSQRENWNTVTPYVTEFWNTFSNVGFFAVGAIFCEPAIMVAGFVSTLQHAFPKAWLVKADQYIATLATVAIGVRYYKGFVKQPETTIPAACVVAGTFQWDMHNAAHCHRNGVHALWHTACACGCYALMQAADGEKLYDMPSFC